MKNLVKFRNIYAFVAKMIKHENINHPQQLFSNPITVFFKKQQFK